VGTGGPHEKASKRHANAGGAQTRLSNVGQVAAKSGRKSKVLIAAPISRKVHIVTPSNSHPKIRRQYTDLQLTAADYLI